MFASWPDNTAAGEKVVVSGANEIAGWQRDGEKWTAPLAAKPAKVLKDGQPFAAFTYDEAKKQIAVAGFDPRLHLLENIVRKVAVENVPGAKTEGLVPANTLP